MSQKRKRTNLFTSDLRKLLYGFGDVSEPLSETVSTLEDILSNYLIDLCVDASSYASKNNRNKIKIEDFKFVLRNDPLKLGRVEELLLLNREIQDAKKGFDDSEGRNINSGKKEAKESKKEAKNREGKESKPRKKYEKRKKKVEQEIVQKQPPINTNNNYEDDADDNDDNDDDLE